MSDVLTFVYKTPVVSLVSAIVGATSSIVSQDMPWLIIFSTFGAGVAWLWKRLNDARKERDILMAWLGEMRATLVANGIEVPEPPKLPSYQSHK